MNVSIRPHDGTVGLSLNKTEQDTLRQTVAIAQDLLHQLHQMESAGQTIDPEQVDALRTLATAMLTDARGVIATSNQQAPAVPPIAYDRSLTAPVQALGQRTAYPYDPSGSLIAPVQALGQRTTMTNL